MARSMLILITADESTTSRLLLRFSLYNAIRQFFCGIYDMGAVEMEKREWNGGHFLPSFHKTAVPHRFGRFPPLGVRDPCDRSSFRCTGYYTMLYFTRSPRRPPLHRVLPGLGIYRVYMLHCKEWKEKGGGGEREGTIEFAFVVIVFISRTDSRTSEHHGRQEGTMRTLKI